MKIRIWPILVLAIALLTFGFATSAFSFGFGDNKFEKEVETEQSAVKLTREVQRGGYDVITTEELKKLIDSGKEILIIDTMPYEDSYKKQHIPGAKQFLFPIPEMETWDTKETDGKTQDDFAALLGPDKDKTIVIYCGFVKCTRSHNGAMWAKKLGYNNVLRQPGGIYAWLGAGYPIEK
jgi:thiosulfate/3-mercaptopyruvate sulfurtransferase